MESQQVKGIVLAFKKLMEQKGSSYETQWNELTLMPTKILSKQVFLERLSAYGLNLTAEETALFWEYFNLRPRTISYDDFVNIMKTTFSPQQMENPATYVLENYTQSRPSTTASQRSSNYTNQNLQPSPQDEQYYDFQLRPRTTQRARGDLSQRTMNYEYSDDEGQKKHSYFLSRSIRDRQTAAIPLSDLKTFNSLSNTTIQRQNFDGPNSPRKSFRTTNSLKKTMATISDAAYSIDTSSWSCFLRWRDPTKDKIDAYDLINALQRDLNIRLNLADVQKVIDKFGPLDQHTFKLMLTEGHKYSLRKDFVDDE